MQTKRLILRDFNEDDLDFLCELQFNPEILKTNIDGLQTRETVKKHLNNFIGHRKQFGFSQMAIFKKESGEFIGRAGISNRTLNYDLGCQSEIRFAILPKFWNQKFAHELIALLQKFAFEDLQLEFLVASTLITNPKSFYLLTKFGFKFIKDIKPCYGNVDSIQYLKITKDEYFNLKKHDNFA
jgi:RimJ/RimL family protein N-acetyltransferase